MTSSDWVSTDSLDTHHRAVQWPNASVRLQTIRGCLISETSTVSFGNCDDFQADDIFHDFEVASAMAPVCTSVVVLKLCLEIKRAKVAVLITRGEGPVDFYYLEYLNLPKPHLKIYNWGRLLEMDEQFLYRPSRECVDNPLAVLLK